jgi:hypothetical protein
MRILVAIANYGPYRFGYLDKVILTYQRMPYPVDLVIHSDRPKRVPAGVRLVVGLPTPDPCSLPFAHKRLFAERQDDYDLFIYTEDDILIGEHNIAAFLEAGSVLREDEIAGLLRYERDEAGRRFFVDAHPPFDWVDGSFEVRGGYTLATFANQHSGCYVLTRAHLRKALRSGGYLVAPHETYYDMRASAATDPYTLCGLTRRICASHLDRFLIHHLPNTYVGVLGTEEGEFRERLGALTAAASQGRFRGGGDAERTPRGGGEADRATLGCGDADRAPLG